MLLSVKSRAAWAVTELQLPIMKSVHTWTVAASCERCNTFFLNRGAERSHRCPKQRDYFSAIMQHAKCSRQIICKTQHTLQSCIKVGTPPEKHTSKLIRNMVVPPSPTACLCRACTSVLRYPSTTELLTVQQHDLRQDGSTSTHSFTSLCTSSCFQRLWCSCRSFWLQGAPTNKTKGVQFVMVGAVSESPATSGNRWIQPIYHHS